MHLWKLRNRGRRSDSTVLKGHKEKVECVVMSANGKRIASGSADGTARVWHLRERIWEEFFLKDHTGSTHRVSVSRGETKMTFGGDNRTVRVWKERNGECKSDELDGHTDVMSCIIVSADGSCIVSGS